MFKSGLIALAPKGLPRTEQVASALLVVNGTATTNQRYYLKQNFS